MPSSAEGRQPGKVADDSAARIDRRRLRLAREARGESQTELAAKAGLSAAAISQFENGAARPSSHTLARIADALDFPPAFFDRASGPNVGEELGGFFRSLRSTSATDRRRARSRAQLLCYFTRVLEEHVQLPVLDLPRRPITDGATEDDVEGIAAEVRNQWKVPAGPIDDVVRLLEKHGIVAARFPVDSEQVDAFSVPFPDRPVVVLGSDKSDRPRSRFDGAHELGHLVMHSEEDCGSKTVETEAHWFAAAFLMPADEIRPLLPTLPDWGRLQELKKLWGVSMQALLMRARNLRVMEPQIYVQAMKTMSARGWRKSEPSYLGPPEMPVLLGRAIQAIEQKGLTLDVVAADASLPMDEVNAFVGAGSDQRPRVEL